MIGLTLAAALAAGYQIELPDSIDLDAGAAGTVSLTLKPDAGRTISRAGPLLVLLASEPDGALELPRRRYRWSDAADAKADAPRFDLAVGAKETGSYRLRVTVRFWICAAHTCRAVREEHTVSIHVRPVNKAMGREYFLRIAHAAWSKIACESCAHTTRLVYARRIGHAGNDHISRTAPPRRGRGLPRPRAVRAPRLQA